MLCCSYLRCSGVHPLDVSIRSRLVLFVLVTHLCSRYEQLETWGVYIDADVTMSAHVTAVVKACFAALRQIRSVRRSLTRTTLLTRVHALVVTRGVAKGGPGGPAWDPQSNPTEKLLRIVWIERVRARHALRIRLIEL